MEANDVQQETYLCPLCEQRWSESELKNGNCPHCGEPIIDGSSSTALPLPTEEEAMMSMGLEVSESTLKQQ